MKYLNLRATLLTEPSFCMSPVSSQLGVIALGGGGVEGEDGKWMTDKVRTGAVLPKASI